MKQKTPPSRTMQIATLPRSNAPTLPRSRHAPTLLTLLTLTTLFTLTTAALAQTPTPPDSAFITPQSSLPIDPGVFAPFLDGLLGKYGWLTTVLLAIGSLRILFKPIMLVVENALKNDPAKYAAVQKFESGPIYKTIATVPDVGAAIKLPLVQPPGPPSP